ncbi:MAG: pyruvate kinase [Eubacteriales bacterium]
MDIQRKTKIICTLGPAVDNDEAVRDLILAGMNAARFNFSHGNHEEQLERLQRLKKVRDQLGAPVATVLDTKGPEIRIKGFKDGPINLTIGDKFTLCIDDVDGTSERVSVTYQNLHNEVAVGNHILVDDGLVDLCVEKINGKEVVCVVESGGPLSNNKSINIPGVNIQLPALTEKDISDLKFGVEQDFDFIAASFVRKAEDVIEIRRILDEMGGQKVKIISKIENKEGVDNLEGIIEVSNALMVARGDLGVEIPAHEVPLIQKRMIKLCNEKGISVITATQMLDSMMRNPRPTRAEVSDVANAVFDNTSCIMLSGETASGKYPIEAVKTMVNIATSAENSIDYWQQFEDAHFVVHPDDITDAICRNCCNTAKDVEAKALIICTHSGLTARIISRYLPQCNIAAFTTDEKFRRQLSIEWGVTAFLYGNVDSTDRLLSISAECAVKEGVVKSGDTVVIVAGVPIGSSGITNLIKVSIIP